MQNYQHPNIPELFARIDKDGSHSVFLRGEKVEVTYKVLSIKED